MAILNWIWKLGCSSNSFKIFFHLLRQSKNISDFDKDDSFDRLFPNQDYHSGKGFGNLIALPLQALPRKEGNSVFLDPENNFEPAVDQWDFLYQVECISTTTLDKLYGKFSEDEENKPSRASKIKNGILPLTLAEYILIPRAAAPKELITFLREKLNFLNSDYVVKQRMGVSVFNLENIKVPRGFLPQLTDFLKEKCFPFEVVDRRNKLKNVAHDVINF